MSDIRTETRLAKIVLIVDQGFAGPLEVVINHGAHQGVKLGDRFLVFGIGPRIVDPDTHEDLGELELVRGRGEVVHVQEHMATLRTIERRRTRPAKRVVREAGSAGFALRGNVIEEELAPEAEMPFDAVRLSDLAKPI
jgi:hypothetical protein